MVIDVNALQPHDPLLKAKAFLDGVEVSQDCFYVDDEAGIVRLYVRGRSGRFYRDPRTAEVAWVERHGDVRIELPEPAHVQNV
jgi:hypothetical protein